MFIPKPFGFIGFGSDASLCNSVTEYGCFQVQSCLGYCPQVDSLIGHLTAAETLYMFARLRGVPSASIPPLVKSLLSIVFLSEYADKMCGNYR